MAGARQRCLCSSRSSSTPESQRFGEESITHAREKAAVLPRTPAARMLPAAAGAVGWVPASLPASQGARSRSRLRCQRCLRRVAKPPSSCPHPAGLSSCGLAGSLETQGAAGALDGRRHAPGLRLVTGAATRLAGASPALCRWLLLPVTLLPGPPRRLARSPPLRSRETPFAFLNAADFTLPRPGWTPRLLLFVQLPAVLLGQSGRKKAQSLFPAAAACQKKKKIKEKNSCRSKETAAEPSAGRASRGTREGQWQSRQRGSKQAPGTGTGAGCGSSSASLSPCTETGRAAPIQPVCSIASGKSLIFSCFFLA